MTESSSASALWSVGCPLLLGRPEAALWEASGSFRCATQAYGTRRTSSLGGSSPWVIISRQDMTRRPSRTCFTHSGQILSYRTSFRPIRRGWLTTCARPTELPLFILATCVGRRSIPSSPRQVLNTYRTGDGTESGKEGLQYWLWTIDGRPERPFDPPAKPHTDPEPQSSAFSAISADRDEPESGQETILRTWSSEARQHVSGLLVSPLTGSSSLS